MLSFREIILRVGFYRICTCKVVFCTAVMCVSGTCIIVQFIRKLCADISGHVKSNACGISLIKVRNDRLIGWARSGGYYLCNTTCIYTVEPPLKDHTHEFRNLSVMLLIF